MSKKIKKSTSISRKNLKNIGGGGMEIERDPTANIFTAQQMEEVGQKTSEIVDRATIEEPDLFSQDSFEASETTSNQENITLAQDAHQDLKDLVADVGKLNLRPEEMQKTPRQDLKQNITDLQKYMMQLSNYAANPNIDSDDHTTNAISQQISSIINETANFMAKQVTDLEKDFNNLLQAQNLQTLTSDYEEFKNNHSQLISDLNKSDNYQMRFLEKKTTLLEEQLKNAQSKNQQINSQNIDQEETISQQSQQLEQLSQQNLELNNNLNKTQERLTQLDAENKQLINQSTQQKLQIKQLQRGPNNLMQALNDAQEEISTLKNNLSSLKQARDKIQGQNQALQSENYQLHDQIDEKNQQIDELTKHLQSTIEVLEQTPSEKELQEQITQSESLNQILEEDNKKLAANLEQQDQQIEQERQRASANLQEVLAQQEKTIAQNSTTRTILHNFLEKLLSDDEKESNEAQQVINNAGGLQQFLNELLAFK